MMVSHLRAYASKASRWSSRWCSWRAPGLNRLPTASGRPHASIAIEASHLASPTQCD